MKYVFLVLYVVLMIGVSAYSMKRARSLDDFFLGGRNVGPWLSAFGYGTAYFSAVIFIGYAGRLGWSMGISVTLIGLANAIFGNFLAWKVLARRTRVMTHSLKVSTMPGFAEKRYDSRALKVVMACVIFIFLVPYSASVYQGLAYLFERAMGLPFEACMVVMACVSGLYLLIGGYLATSLSDFIQGTIMLVGVGLMLFFVMNHIGGIGEGIKSLNAIDPNLTSIVGKNPMPLLWLIIMTSFGSWGLPQMVHKFYAVKDASAVKRGTIISTLFALVVAGGAYFLGAFGRVVLENQAPANLETVMPEVLMRTMPDALLGVIVVLVLAASLSTLTSVVLASSSAIAIDLVKGAIKPDMTKENVQSLLRLLCAGFIGLSLVMAFQKQATIITMMSFSWGTVAGVTLAPYLYGLYWKRATKAGAWASVLATLAVSLSGITAITVYNVTALSAPMLGSLSIITGLVVMPIVSLFTKAPKAQTLDVAFKEI